MKFNEMVYVRPDYEEIKKQITEKLEVMKNTAEPDVFYAAFKEIDVIREHYMTMSTLCSIRHSVDTRDEFYEKETDYWNEYSPYYNQLDNEIAKVALACDYKEQLYDRIPETYFKICEFNIKGFDEKIIPLMQQENKLTTEYGRLKASAQIEMDGKIYNLSSISPLTQDLDENVRRKAWNAKLSFYEEHEADFDRIYDELVKVRDEMAHQLGYPSFTELGYIRMLRLDYNAEMVANYRKQILKDVVPVANELYKQQCQRLGVSTLAYYNENMEFLTGNPTPKGTYEELIAAARKMYHEMSPETAEFIDLMIDNEMWDLKSKDGKEMGGYCTSIPDYKTPFIFANFNGTSGDVDVLTHEAGHAFQYYMSRNIEVSDLQWPTMESAEIHSMSMEFNAWPWIDLFFKEDTDKYRYHHLGAAVKFLPYGVTVDHFQHEVYAHPEWTPEERKTCWRELEKMYLPHKNYEGAPILEKGCWWYQQGHIFESPFYYIDYTLAQVCALQFWDRHYRKDPQAWNDYVTLCKLGGTKSFTGLVEAAHLNVPFNDNCISHVMKDVQEYLENAPGRLL